MKPNKNTYRAPSITQELIILESGIAVGSATLKPGKSDSPFVPEVEDWTDNGNQNKDFDVL
ncbi:MAG: hypothetical protein ACI35Z_09105 [Sphingobacterium hotanense]